VGVFRGSVFRVQPGLSMSPLAGSIFEHPAKLSVKTNSKLNTVTTKSFNVLIALLKVA
jgi:hypothetical protein